MTTFCNDVSDIIRQQNQCFSVNIKELFTQNISFCLKCSKLFALEIRPIMLRYWSL